MTDVAMESLDRSTIPASVSFAKLLAPGISAVRRFWRPFLLLQGCALALVMTYFGSEAARAACERLARWHDQGGLLFSGISAAIAGSMLPELAKRVLPNRKPMGPIDELAAARVRRRNDIAFAFVVFAINGIFTDLQFRGIGLIFGYDGHFLTSVKKVLFDQFVTTPIYGTLYWAAVYRWRALNYSIPRLGRELSFRWYVEQVVPLLIPGWCFWIPMDLMVYSMPKPLQFCLFCLALAAWSLLMVFIATRVEEV